MTHTAEIDAGCPLTCLNRLAPECVIHRPHTAEIAARREVEDLWWLRDSLESLLGELQDRQTIRVGMLRNLLKTTAPETKTTHPRVTPPEVGESA